MLLKGGRYISELPSQQSERGEDDGRGQEAKKSKSGQRPRVRPVTRQQRDAQTAHNTRARHSKGTRLHALPLIRLPLALPPIRPRPPASDAKP